MNRAGRRRSMTVAELRLLLDEFAVQPDTNEDEYVVLQDEYGAESEVSEGVVVNGVLFLIPDRAFEDGE